MKGDPNCAICHGDGQYLAKCITCRATGKVYNFGSKENETCPDCNGTKEKLNECQKSVWQILERVRCCTKPKKSPAGSGALNLRKNYL